MGVYGDWQPHYADLGLATFPVIGDEKRPAVKNYLLGGISASHEWARKYPECDAMGLACGSRNRLTIVDIDLPDENLVAEVISKLGDSPIIARTASGKFHIWYRHNGESRKIRAKGFDGPVDILGGGYAIVPPSRTGTGQYEFLQGSLADVHRLPTINGRAMLDRSPRPRHLDEYHEDIVREGKRNRTLWGECMRAAKKYPTRAELEEFAEQLNRSISSPPLQALEVQRVVSSAWQKTQNGENWSGTSGRVTVGCEEVDTLMPCAPDALLLLVLLRREHNGRRDTFYVANAMSETMGWPRKRFAAARKTLLLHRYLELVSPDRGPGVPAVYRFPRQ